MIDELVGILTDAATDDTLRAISIERRRRRLLLRCRLGGHQRLRATPPHRRSGAPYPPYREPGDRTPHHHPPAGGRAAVRGWAVGPGLQPRARRRLHRRRRRCRCSGSRSCPAVSARTRAPPGCCPGWSAWPGPGGCCCSARRSAVPDAADWGLIHPRSDAAELDAAADELLARLASGPTVAIGLAKQALHYGQHATLSQSLTQELAQPRTLLPDSRFQGGPGRRSGSVAHPTSRAGRKETHGGTVCRRLRHHHLRGRRAHGDHHVEPPGRAQRAEPRT